MTDREFVEILKEGIPERHSASEPIAEKKAQTERAPDPQPPGWLTVPEVAKLLDLAPKTIYLLSGKSTTSARRLPSHRLGPRGGKLRFDPADVRAYIAAMKTVQPEVAPSRKGYQILEPRRPKSSRRPS